MCGVIGDLLMQGQKRDRGVKGLPRLRSQADYFKPSGMDLLSELINSHVRGSTDKNLAWIHLRKVVDNRRGCDGFTGARRTLDETKRLLEDTFDCIHLGVVEFRKTGGREAFRHLSAQNLRFEFMAQ